MSVRARLVPALLIAGMVAGCATKAPCPAPSGAAAATPAAAAPEWQDVVTDPDHVRLRGWRQSFVDALARARKDGHGAAIDAEGAMLDPDRGQEKPDLPAGTYLCTIVKLGSKEAGHTSFIRYPTHHCRVTPAAQGLMRFVELDGLQRPSGLLYPDTTSRVVFLGTMVLGDEIKAISYGRDADRDMVGALQRVSEARWRMLFPDPAWESQMDVLELVPEG